MSKIEEFEDKLQKLSLEFKIDIVCISTYIKDNGKSGISIFGNMCFICAKEDLEQVIEEQSIVHFSDEESEKVH